MLRLLYFEAFLAIFLSCVLASSGRAAWPPDRIRGFWRVDSFNEVGPAKAGGNAASREAEIALDHLAAKQAAEGRTSLDQAPSYLVLADEYLIVIYADELGASAGEFDVSSNPNVSNRAFLHVAATNMQLNGEITHSVEKWPAEFQLSEDSILTGWISDPDAKWLFRATRPTNDRTNRIIKDLLDDPDFNCAEKTRKILQAYGKQPYSFDAKK